MKKNINDGKNGKIQIFDRKKQNTRTNKKEEEIRTRILAARECDGALEDKD